MNQRPVESPPVMDAVRGRSPSKVQNYIRDWRWHRGLTLEELGERIGCEKITLSRWERGERKIFLDYLQVIAEALDCTLYDLLFRKPSETIVASIARCLNLQLDHNFPLFPAKAGIQTIPQHGSRLSSG